MQDTVRRSGERLGVQVGAPPDFRFATLYRHRRWERGVLSREWEGGRNLPAGENPESLFANALAAWPG